MTRFLRHWFPEIAIAIVAGYFFYRELGTFPRSWIDEGLFIMTARTIASGHGYAIPLLDHLWRYPYFLAVGPTVILPVALSIKLFGVGIAAARLPMTAYLWGVTIGTYFLTHKIAGRTAARWSAALLISLSAFVNTGKPVLGEVPGFFFVLLGIIAMSKRGSVMRDVGAGVAFGLAVVSKLTYGIVLPALGLVWIAALIRRDWKNAWRLPLIGIIALGTYLPWHILELRGGDGVVREIVSFLSSGNANNSEFLNVLRTMPELLLRLPYLAFACIAVLGCAGLLHVRKKLPWETWWLMVIVIAAFTLYALNLYGWYRHLLAAHLLLLPFVPSGAEKIGKKTYAISMLTVIVTLQAGWQLTYQGSGQGTALAEAVMKLKTDYVETNLLVEESEIFAQLPENPRWLYLIRDAVSPTMPAVYREPEKSMRCFTHVRRLSPGEKNDRTTILAGDYAAIAAPKGCR